MRAALYLETKGYRIEGRNVRAGGVEMDLIARRGGLVVFIEVKTRRTRLFGPPEMAVDTAKRRRLVRGAQVWLNENGRGVAGARFDVIGWQVESTSTGEMWHLRHLEAAFEAGD